MKEFELEPGEIVVRQTRKHWLVFLIGLMPYAILVVLPFALPNIAMLAPASTPYIGNINFAHPLSRVVVGIWLLLVWTAAWSSFTRYFLNLWVLTNQRIVTIKQSNYFNREVSSVLLNRVQDVTTNVHGLISSLLNIGRITVQSAGEEREFTMRDIPNPEEMRDLILKYVPDGTPAGGA